MIWVGQAMPVSRRYQGFTLLEVLLAAVIGAFILLVALVAFRTVTVSRDELQIYSDLQARGQAIYRQMQKDLAGFYRSNQPEQMKIVCETVQYNNRPADRLLFYRINDPVINQQNNVSGDLFEIEYGLVGVSENQVYLGRRAAPVTKADDGNDRGVVTRLAEGVIALAFEFYDGRTWQHGWNSEINIPSMVRLNMVLTDREGKIELPFSHEFSLEPIPAIESDKIES